MRPWRLRLRPWWRCVELGDLQFCRRDRRNRRERNSQRRNGLRGSSSDGDGIETRGDFGNGPAAPEIAAECVPRNVEKRLGKCIGDARVGLTFKLQGRCILRECFDQGHAERPDVSGSGERRGRGFGSVVSIELAR